jgi:hypothetical protein
MTEDNEGMEPSEAQFIVFDEVCETNWRKFVDAHQEFNRRCDARANMMAPLFGEKPVELDAHTSRVYAKRFKRRIDYLENPPDIAVTLRSLSYKPKPAWWNIPLPELFRRIFKRK